eukprot:TRINITY_DN3997_c0_g1_i1.p1 TRINITY_DN3997_c0_g1~~TRINITY_DN3997_c0_g1_i1.p1  ORF type:complete len:338 (+),score=172.81 TRINITY_DN3997_c0_g1_i1:61-1074(+)
MAAKAANAMARRTTGKTPFLLNWYANPYHTPIFVAKEKGYFQDEGIDIAVLETTNPSDVTEIIGAGNVPMGLKAMIHILAAKHQGLEMTSFGTLLDEPPTGLIYKDSNPIKTFDDIKGRRIGYIGHFGKVMVEDLAKQAGIPLDSFECVRVGMNVTDAIQRGVVDAGIGFTNFQRLELEELSGEKAGMLRIDELNGLGCCCFCSIQYVANNEWLAAEGSQKTVEGFMRAVRRGTDDMIEDPEVAWETMTLANPRLRTDLYTKIYQRTLPYFSRDLLNVQRDWNKVGMFCKHLGIMEEDFDQHSVYTNEYVPDMGTPNVEPVTVGGILRPQVAKAASC